MIQKITKGDHRPNSTSICKASSGTRRAACGFVEAVPLEVAEAKLGSIFESTKCIEIQNETNLDDLDLK